MNIKSIIKAYYNEGYTVKEISKKIEMKLETVINILNEVKFETDSVIEYDRFLNEIKEKYKKEHIQKIESYTIESEKKKDVKPKMKAEHYYKKICSYCKKYFETEIMKKRFCSNECLKNYYKKIVKSDKMEDLIAAIRLDYLIIKHENPQLAEEIKEQMELEEGIDFTILALDGLVSYDKKKK